MISSNRKPNSNLAPGFRFHPTDLELLTFYLYSKVSNLPIPIDAITELEIYKHAPWDLPAFSPLKTLDKEWFFFCPLGRKYDRGSRPNRATEDGFWKSTGKDREIFGEEKVVGMKKILVFHVGRAPKGRRTGWVMHEYRLVEDQTEGKYNNASSFVLCRVFEKSAVGKSKGDQYGPCIIEEDEAQDLVEAASDSVHSDDREQGTIELMGNADRLIKECGAASSKLTPPSNALVAPGFRFHPTDEELVSYYLKRKISGLSLPIDAIAEVNLYKWSPWDLPSLSPLSHSIHTKEWYFFSALDRKYAPSHCGITNRATAKGHWKSTGNDRPVHSNVEAKIIGMKKTLVFHIGRAPYSKKTNWVMHEYRLEEDEQNSSVSSFVVCKIHKKTDHGPRSTGSEKEEIEQHLVPSKDNLDARHDAFDATPNVCVDSAKMKNCAPSNCNIQVTTTGMYSTGSRVEISYIREQIPIAWYTATVMEVIDERILMVEYESLRSKDGTLINEIVSTQYIRPHPPTLEVRNFELLNEVEAFYSGGWWPGVIAKVNAGSRYNVKFMHWEEEIEFNHAELRLLYDWVDGQWIQASLDKSRELQKLCRPNSVGHMQLFHASNTACKCKVPDSITTSSSCGDDSCEFSSSSTSFENEDSNGSTFRRQQDLLLCKKARKGETTEDNKCLMNSRSIVSSNAVKTGFDCPPIVEERPNSHVRDLVEKCCPASPFENINISSADSIATELSSILSEQVEKYPQINQRRRELVPGIELQEKKGAMQNTKGEQRGKNCKHRRLRIIQPSLKGDTMGNKRSTEGVKLPIEVCSADRHVTCNDNGSEARGPFNVMSTCSDASLEETLPGVERDSFNQSFDK